MKKLLITLIGIITFSATFPAVAGPDFQAIEQARKAARDAASQTVAASSTSSKDCESQKLILPLDHGPRAQTTPYLNQQRKGRFEADMKACKEAAAK